MSYPRVFNEFDTVLSLLAGKSISRFGDGELKILDGYGYSREPANQQLANELRTAFYDPPRNLLLGIPTLDPAGPKYEGWIRHTARFLRHIERSKNSQWFSAFISRPDSAPAILGKPFAISVQALWSGKRRVVVCETNGSMLPTVEMAKGRTIHVECPRSEAFAVIDDLEREVLQADPDIVILSAGPTASILAARLCARGVQAIDLGSAGGWLGRLLRNEPPRAVLV